MTAGDVVLIGYARVSTDDQNLDLQRDALRATGCQRIYEDRMRGAKAARPGRRVRKMCWPCGGLIASAGHYMTSLSWLAHSTMPGSGS
jgi:hypothetical protein